MKFFLYTTLYFASLFGGSQNGAIYGKITDGETVNSPLLFANVLLKETNTKLLTDENGLFKFNDLKEGSYTLVCSFTGYTTKEIIVEAHNNNTKPITLSLNPSNLSLDDLNLVYASSSKLKGDTTK